MKPTLAAFLFVGACLAQPAWLTHYPGATVQTRSSPGLTEASYEVRAKPADVAAHYQKLFETAGLPFNPAFDGVGTVIRASAPECDLLLKIREVPSGASVRVSCAAKTPALTAVPEAPRTTRAIPKSMEERIAEGREHTRQMQADADAQHRKRIQDMEKYDAPVAPRPKKPLVWPKWLTDPDGAPLESQKFAGSLTSSFTTSADRESSLAYYKDLLAAHGCEITTQSKSWLHSDTVSVELAPAQNATKVTLRYTP
jgi:hypothetical protein